jgi:hypothetical protein
VRSLSLATPAETARNAAGLLKRNPADRMDYARFFAHPFFAAAPPALLVDPTTPLAPRAPLEVKDGEGATVLPPVSAAAQTMVALPPGSRVGAPAQGQTWRT